MLSEFRTSRNDFGALVLLASSRSRSFSQYSGLTRTGPCGPIPTRASESAVRTWLCPPVLSSLCELLALSPSGAALLRVGASILLNQWCATLDVFLGRRYGLAASHGCSLP